MKHKEKLLSIGVCTIVFLVFGIASIPCPIRHIIHVPCPGCGFSRCCKALLRFDFKEAFYYYPMFWGMPIILYYCCQMDKLVHFEAKTVVPFVIICSLFVITYLYRLHAYLIGAYQI